MSWKLRESFGWIRIGGFLLVALLIAVGAFRIWNAEADAVETETPPPAAAVEPEVEPEQEAPMVEEQLPPYMLPDPESPEFVPAPPRVPGETRSR